MAGRHKGSCQAKIPNQEFTRDKISLLSLLQTPCDAESIRVVPEVLVRSLIVRGHDDRKSMPDVVSVISATGRAHREATRTVEDGFFSIARADVRLIPKPVHIVHDKETGQPAARSRRLGDESRLRGWVKWAEYHAVHVPGNTPRHMDKPVDQRL